MIVLCEKCGLRYDDENRWTICPHGPLWAPASAYCREHDLVFCKLCTDPAVIEASAPRVAELGGRYFLYNFDFVHFREQSEETIRPVNPFILTGFCWKFKFHGGIKVWISGKLIVDLAFFAAGAFPLAVPISVTIEDDICVQVADYQRRNFRWFRPNTARVTLEGLEQPIVAKLDGEMQKFSQ